MSGNTLSSGFGEAYQRFASLEEKNNLHPDQQSVMKILDRITPNNEAVVPNPFFEFPNT
jgi:hypothetical protein